MPRRISWTPPDTPFTLAHVAPLGVTPAMLRWAESSERVTRLATGVFIASTALPDDASARHVLQAHALQLRNPAAIASHQTAALAWGLDLPSTRDAAASIPQFILPQTPRVRSRRTPDLRIAVRPLPTKHRGTHPSGLRVTSRARTAVDVAGDHDLPEALVTLDSAARRHLVEAVGERGLRAAYARTSALLEARAPLLEAVGPAATQFSRARLLHAVPLADPRRESANESLSYGHFVMAGIPVPELQARIPTSIGDLFPDFLWPHAMVIGEADGALKYTGAESLVREKRRQEILEDLGFRVVRWMHDDIVRRPGWVITRVTRALAARSPE